MIVKGPGIVVPQREEWVGPASHGRALRLDNIPTIRHGGHVWRQHEESAGWYLEHPIFGLTQERDIPHNDRPWRPFVDTIPYRNGVPDPDVLKGHEAFFSNSHYLVFTRVLEPGHPHDADKIVTQDAPVMVHLSMRTVENDVRHDWREMQRVKTEILGPDWEGVELYPREERVVDTANQFHLWCVQEVFPFGFGGGLRLDAGEAPETIKGGKQRAFR